MSKEWKIYENEVYEECCRIYGEEKVERNIFRKGVSSRTPRQIDVLVHTEEGDIAFDAKYYSEHVDVKKIDEMAGMYADLGVSKFVVVTNKGYSEAALNRAYYGNENVEADILSMEELKLLQGYIGLVRVGQNGVFICAPFSWVLDVQKSAHPQMPYVLYRQGLTYKQACPFLCNIVSACKCTKKLFHPSIVFCFGEYNLCSSLWNVSSVLWNLHSTRWNGQHVDEKKYAYAVTAPYVTTA